MDITTKIEAKRNELTERVIAAAAKGDTARMLDAVALLEQLARTEAILDVMADLDDSELTAEGIGTIEANYDLTI